MNYALQLYTMRQPAAQDVVGTLQRVREIGWTHVQWSGMPTMTAQQIRDALQQADLKPVICHCAVQEFETDFETAVAYWKTAGFYDVAAGMMMTECRDSLEGWLDGARRLDAIGANLRAVGMRLSYHNHSFEFETFEGDSRCKLDMLYEETGPQNLYAELDTAWLEHGGVDPAAYIRKMANRCPVIHLKDINRGYTKDQFSFVPLGQGALNWPEIFQAARDAGVEWAVYEQDTTTDPFEDCRVSLEFLKAHLS